MNKIKLSNCCLGIITAVSTLIFVSLYAIEPALTDSESISTFKDSLESGGDGPEMVIVDGGTFHMGCQTEEDCRDEELPVHEVLVAKFALGKYEVTFAEYDKFAKATESRLSEDFGWGRDDSTGYQRVLDRSAGIRSVAISRNRRTVPFANRSGMGVCG